MIGQRGKGTNDPRRVPLGHPITPPPHHTTPSIQHNTTQTHSHPTPRTTGPEGMGGFTWCFYNIYKLVSECVFVYRRWGLWGPRPCLPSGWETGESEQAQRRSLKPQPFSPTPTPTSLPLPPPPPPTPTPTPTLQCVTIPSVIASIVVGGWTWRKRRQLNALDPRRTRTLSDFFDKLVE